MLVRSAILIAIMLGGFTIAHANPRASEKALFCKTQGAIKSLYEFHTAFPKASLADSVTMVNTSDPAAGCDLTPLIYDLGEIVADVKNDEEILDIRKVSVLAICSEEGCVPVKKEGFSAFTVVPTL